MRKSTFLVYEGTLIASGTGGYTVSTPPEMERALAESEKLVGHLQTDPATVTGLGTVGVTLSHSADGLNYISLATPTLTPTAAAVSTTAQANYHFAVSGSTTALDRIRITVSGTSSASSQARFRIWATLRDDA